MSDQHTSRVPAAESCEGTAAGTPCRAGWWEGKPAAGPALDITVYGRPAGQGNLKSTGSGRLRHDNGTELRIWRDLIAGAVITKTGRHRHAQHPYRKDVTGCVVCGVPKDRHALLLGPVVLEALVVVERPKTVTREYPTARSVSDLDHYARAIGDALTGLAYRDDSQVVDSHLSKRYPCPATLPQPGAVIHLWEVS